MKTKKITARESFARADIFLSENLEGYTRSAVKKLFDGGLVLINGKPAKKPSVPVNEGDEAEVTLPDAVKYCAKPEDIPV